MFALFCLGISLDAAALDPSVRSWLAAEDALEAGRPADALPALESASAGVAAPLATLQLAMLQRAALTDAPASIDAFVVAVEALGAVRYDALRALSLAEPGTAPGFDRAVVSRQVYAHTAAALTLQAAALREAGGQPAEAQALRERIVALWPESIDGRHLKRQGGVAVR